MRQAGMASYLAGGVDPWSLRVAWTLTPATAAVVNIAKNVHTRRAVMRWCWNGLGELALCSASSCGKHAWTDRAPLAQQQLMIYRYGTRWTREVSVVFVPRQAPRPLDWDLGQRQHGWELSRACMRRSTCKRHVECHAHLRGVPMFID